MKVKIITYLSIICLILILVMQGYIVFDHFRSIEISLKRETDAILESAYHKELNIRRSMYKLSESNRSIKHEQSDTINIDRVKNSKLDRNDYINLLNLALEKFFGKNHPMRLERVDSLAALELTQRHINSEFVVQTINPRNDSIFAVSKTGFEPSIFSIKSKPLSLDLDGRKALQLVLTNPMKNIFSQLGYLLVGSLILVLICSYGLWFLFYTLAKQKQLQQVKNDFFGHTAHELKRPVAQLHMALEAISRPTIDENKLKKERYLAIMKDATRDMSEKIGMIMTLSMAEEGVFKLNYSNFDLIELIDKLREKFTVVTDKTVSIQFAGESDQMFIHADHDHIRQTIANLIDNAIKYSNDTVIITISVTREKGNLMLCVKDNGIGIAADKINSVFEKYTRINSAPGSPSGFGIGLSYVKAVIEKHAGHIEVSSELSKGSEFRVYLPDLI